LRFIEVVIIAICIMAMLFSTAQGTGDMAPEPSDEQSAVEQGLWEEGANAFLEGGTQITYTTSGGASTYTPINTILPLSPPMSTIPPSTQQQLVNEQAKINQISNEIEAMAQREQAADRRAYLYAVKCMLININQFISRYLIGVY